MSLMVLIPSYDPEFTRWTTCYSGFVFTLIKIIILFPNTRRIGFETPKGST